MSWGQWFLLAGSIAFAALAILAINAALSVAVMP